MSTTLFTNYSEDDIDHPKYRGQTVNSSVIYSGKNDCQGKL